MRRSTDAKAPCSSNPPEGYGTLHSALEFGHSDPPNREPFDSQIR